MKRRDFLIATAMLVPSLQYAEAQQPTKKKRIALQSRRQRLKTCGATQITKLGKLN